MRILQTLVLFLTVAIPSFANPIGERKALQNADAFLRSKGLPSAEGKLHLAYRSTMEDNNSNAYFYVFNHTDGKGFVILSGDDQTVPVLAYSDQGAFDINNLPGNVRWWMEYYKEAVREVAEKKLKNAPALARPADVIQPMLRTKWNQDGPYNGLCPVINGTRCPTGCVATAMAQVIYYHKCPEGECSAIPSYTTQSHNVFMPSLPATTFDWENMHNSYNSQSSQESKDAVAKLMQYCGQAVKMDYTPASSGAMTDGLTTILPRYFKFPWTIHNVSREGYTIAQWDSLLINELKNNRPVLYTGYTSAWEGHAFVCDGYDGKGFYHINWGWGGAADGHYRISVLDATANGIGGSSTSLRFNVMQSALIGVKTSGEDDYVQPVKAVSVGRPSLKDGRQYTRDDSSMDFKGIIVAQSFVNITDPSAHKNEFSVGMGLFNEEDSLVKKLASVSSYLWNGYAFPFEISLKGFGKEIENGHFTIRPIYAWKEEEMQLARNADHYYVDVLIEGNNLTLTPVPSADFSVTRVRKSGDNIVVSLTNPGGEYCGDIYVRKIQEDGTIGDVASESVCIEENTSRDIAIYIDGDHPLDINNEVYFLSTDFYEDQYFYSNVSNEGTQLGCEIFVSNLSDDKTTIIGDKILCSFDVSNTGDQFYKHYFTMALVNADGEKVYADRNLLYVPQKGMTTVSGELPLTEFGDGYRLVALAYVGKEEVTVFSSEPYRIAQGAIYWTAGGDIRTKLADEVFEVPDDALAINLRNAFTKDVVPNANPNTVYLLDQTVPKGLKGKNVFNFENKAGYLTINDGFDFFTPVALEITMNAKFIRSFSSDDLTKWTSITLPFAPVRVQVDGKNIGWFKHSDDYGKEFWLQRVAKVSNGVIDLDYVDEFKTGEPYLMAIGEQLAGKTVEFITLNMKMPPTPELEMAARVDGYWFRGQTCAAEKDAIFLLVDHEFVFDADCREAAPFRVFVESEFNNPDVLTINGPEIVSNISEIPAMQFAADDDVYRLNGIYVGKYRDVNKFQKGIYVVKGMKLVVK